MWPTCMHLIWVNWQTKCERQVSLQTDSTILTAWTSLAPIATRCMVNTLMFETASGLGCHQPTFTKTTAFRLNCISQPSQKRWWKDAYLNHHGSPSLKLKNLTVFFFAAAPKKRLCFFLELPRRIFRNAGRESGANPEGALPFQSHLVVFEYDKWTFGESIDVSSWWSFSKMYYVYIILYHIF